MRSEKVKSIQPLLSNIIVFLFNPLAGEVLDVKASLPPAARLGSNLSVPVFCFLAFAYAKNK